MHACISPKQHSTGSSTGSSTSGSRRTQQQRTQPYPTHWLYLVLVSSCSVSLVLSYGEANEYTRQIGTVEKD